LSLSTDGAALRLLNCIAPCVENIFPAILLEKGGEDFIMFFVIGQ
jgi:hypothetical protein